MVVEIFVSSFKPLSRNLNESTEKDHRKPLSEQSVPGQDSNQ